jgi:hypothetical protein
MIFVSFSYWRKSDFVHFPPGSSMATNVPEKIFRCDECNSLIVKMKNKIKGVAGDQVVSGIRHV